MTDFFSSRELRRGVQCGYGSHNDKAKEEKEKKNSSSSSKNGSTAEACSRAHSSAAAAAALSDFLGNSLALLVAPVLGRASDVVIVGIRGGSSGNRRRSLRSKYLSFALLSSALPPLTLALHSSLHSSSSSPPPPLLYLYFLFSAIATAAPGAAICLAYAADALPAGRRAPAFAAVSAAVSAGLLLGAGTGAFLEASTAAWLATVGVAVSGLLAAWLPEAASGTESSGGGRRSGGRAADETAATTGAAKNSAGSSSSSSSNPLSAFRLLTSTPQASRLLACVVLSAAAAQGLSDTISQFLQQRLEFGAGDQALLLAVAGGGGLFAQAAVLPLLLSWKLVAGEAGLLRFGLAGSLLEHSLLIFARSRAAALAAVGIGSLGGLSLPAASALAADSGPAAAQGEVQGALSAARSGAAAVGPLAFAGIYYLSSRSTAAAGPLAGLPFAFGAALLMSALILAQKVGPAVAARGAPAEERDPEEADEEEEAAPLL